MFDEYWYQNYTIVFHHGIAPPPHPERAEGRTRPRNLSTKLEFRSPIFKGAYCAYPAGWLRRIGRSDCLPIRTVAVDDLAYPNQTQTPATSGQATRARRSRKAHDVHTGSGALKTPAGCVYSSREGMPYYVWWLGPGLMAQRPNSAGYGELCLLGTKICPHS